MTNVKFGLQLWPQSTTWPALIVLGQLAGLLGL